jgi:oligopeptide transport system ATP-binding protein
MSEELLVISGLKTYFFSYQGVVRAVDGVDLKIRRRETLGVVGETGCGKSVTALSILRLISPPGRIVGGEILFEGESLLKKSEDEMRKVRGAKISMIFQDPTASLNPVLPVGLQMTETIIEHMHKNKPESLKTAVEILEAVGIADPLKRVKSYSYELSTGMRQRIMIAMALSCNPKLLIADEPTSSLDVTIQAQILELMRNLKKSTNTSIMLITHDLGIVAEMCDKVAIMYLGNVVEYGPMRTIFKEFKHPYVLGLLSSVPMIHKSKEMLVPIPGSVPSPINPPPGCKFHPRCPKSMPVCLRECPKLIDIGNDHIVACHLYG